MKEIIEILMKRDGMDKEEAKTLVKETVDEIICNPDDAEEIIANYLGLESDYIDYLF